MGLLFRKTECERLGHWWSEPVALSYLRSGGHVVCHQQRTWEVEALSRRCLRVGCTACDSLVTGQTYVGWE